MKAEPLKRATFLGMAAAAACATRASAFTRLHPNFGRVIEGYHAADRFDGIALVAFGDRIVYRGAAGLANRERMIAHTPSERFRIASVTKQFTSLLIMQEVERGTMRLDAPIGSYIAALPEAVAAITLRQLLKNTSGLPNLDTIPQAYTRTDMTPADLPTYVRALPLTPLLTAPGKKFSYNNLDFLLAGAALQSVTGSTFASLVRDRVTAKLGLHATGVYGATIPETDVKGYELTGATLGPENIGRLQNFGPAGAMYSTLDDLARWDRALHRNTLLGRAATDEMFAPDAALGYVALGSWAYDLRYGAGPERVHLVERQGNIGGIQILNLFSPSDDITLIMMANTDNADLFNTYSRSGLPYQLIALAASAVRGAVAS